MAYQDAVRDLRITALGEGVAWSSLTEASPNGEDYDQTGQGWGGPIARALDRPRAPSGACPEGAFSGDGNRCGSSLVFRRMPAEPETEEGGTEQHTP